MKIFAFNYRSAIGPELMRSNLFLDELSQIKISKGYLPIISLAKHSSLVFDPNSPKSFSYSLISINLEFR